MKPLIKKLVSLVVGNDYAWAILDSTILQAARFAEWERQKLRPPPREALIDSAIRTHFPDLTVRHGPFRGMKYPEASSITGRLFPKLIGSYEREIHPVLEKLCETPYTRIVNIGCGEGYYAVGLALRFPSATVYAYDIDPNAIRHCERMAELNDVADRIVTGTIVGINIFRSLPATERVLIVSDCEGYEKELFNNEAIKTVANHDLLIEIHDFVDLQISSLLYQRFQATHQIEVIPSIDDIKKAQTYQYEELSAYDLPTRRTLLAEERQSIMEWFFLRPKFEA